MSSLQTRNQTHQAMSKEMEQNMNLVKRVGYFLHRMRKSGTSTFIKNFASEPGKAWIVVADEKSKKEFGPNAITIEGLKSIEGLERRPIIFDNHAVLNIFQAATDVFRHYFYKSDENHKLFVEQLFCTLKAEAKLAERDNTIALIADTIKRWHSKEYESEDALHEIHEELVRIERLNLPPQPNPPSHER
jgi:hypothetical protein